MRQFCVYLSFVKFFANSNKSTERDQVSSDDQNRPSDVSRYIVQPCQTAHVLWVPCHSCTIAIWGGGTLGLDKSTRQAGGNFVSGIDGIGHGGNEDEEREGIQSRKAELDMYFSK